MTDPRNSQQKRDAANRANTIKRLKMAEDRILSDLRNGKTVKNAQARLEKIRLNVYGVEF
jgi:hypothetical protein